MRLDIMQKKMCKKKVSLHIKTKNCGRKLSYKNDTTTHMGFIISRLIQLIMFKKINVFYFIFFSVNYFWIIYTIHFNISFV